MGFKIITWPFHQDGAQNMNMVIGVVYQFVDPVTGVVSQATAPTSSVVNPTTGVITVTPAGSPSTIVYTPNICHDIFVQDSLTFVAIDADGLASAPATVTMNSTTNVCSHVF